VDDKGGKDQAELGESVLDSFEVESQFGHRSLVIMMVFIDVYFILINIKFLIPRMLDLQSGSVLHSVFYCLLPNSQCRCRKR
jgi:hypothetical protein